MLRRVDESNSEYEQTPLPAAPGAADAFATVPEPAPVEAAPPPIDGRRGLLVWLGLLIVFGVGGVLTGQSELALLVAMSGIFVAAQAADLDERWSLFYHLVAWVVPVGGAAMYVTMGYTISRSDLAPPGREPVLLWTAAATMVSFVTIFRPVSDRVVRLLFRTTASSHSVRLAGRIALIGLMLSVPGYFAFQGMLATFSDGPSDLFDQISAGGGLFGYILLALATVGFLVRRTLPQTLERLGIRGLNAVDMIAIGIGVIGLLALNTGADWIQERYFTHLWNLDRRMNEAIAGGLGPLQVAVVGLSAGIGEEITLRGALQPKLGLVLTSLLFAALHVQYTWFGMAVIFFFGVILGWIRQRSSTSVAMAVHVLYDVVALFTT